MGSEKKPNPPWLAGLDSLADYRAEAEALRNLSFTQRGRRIQLAIRAAFTIWAARFPGAPSPPQEPRSKESIRQWRFAMRKFRE